MGRCTATTLGSSRGTLIGAESASYRDHPCVLMDARDKRQLFPAPLADKLPTITWAMVKSLEKVSAEPAEQPLANPAGQASEVV
jgi:hypothetical protein